MTVLVDIGNSRIKWCLLQSPNQVAAVRHNNDWQAACNICFADLEPGSGVFISCVAGTATRDFISDWLWRERDCKPVFIKSERQRHDLTNIYDDPASLGVDRWLAMVAAWQHSRRAFCLFDFGTALTIDIVDDNGRHQGGWIIVGREMQLRSLESLPAIKLATALPDWGDVAGVDSVTAMCGGASLALLAAVRQVSASCQSRYGSDMNFYCCGGDMPAPELMPAANWCREPHLVLHGLAITAVEELPA